MYPTFEDGAKLRCSRLYSSNLKIDGIYVYTREEDGEEYLVVKRLKHICIADNGVNCYFLGDNLDDSLDSRHYGWVHIDRIVAKVI